MFEGIINFFKKFSKEKGQESKNAAKERLQLVLMQDRANVSADFLELMKQEIIEVIKKYVDVDENLIDVTLTNTVNKDGTTGAPALYANIPIVSLKDETKKINIERKKEDSKVKDTKKEEVKEEKVKEEEVVEEEKVEEKEEVAEEVVEEKVDDKVEEDTSNEDEKIEEDNTVVEEIKEETKEDEQIKIEDVTSENKDEEDAGEVVEEE